MPKTGLIIVETPDPPTTNSVGETAGAESPAATPPVSKDATPAPAPDTES